jgi:hypothetical protein
MFERALLSIVAAIALLAVGAGSAAAARPCTADDLSGSRVPAELGDLGLDSQSQEPLIAGTGYRIVVVRERAIGDKAQPIDASIAVTTPSGPPLQPATENDRPAYDFTPPAAGSVRIVVSWDDEIGYHSGDVCSTSFTVDLPVLQPTLAQVLGRFSGGQHSFESSFLLRLKGTKPQDPGKVSMVLRARRGTTRPPAPQGKALGRFTFTPTGDGGFQGSGNDRDLRHTFTATQEGAGVRIYPYGNIAFGRTLRFAFSLEVVQDGRRIGGMRSGAKCRRKQFSGHSAVKCHAVGLKQQP